MLGRETKGAGVQEDKDAVVRDDEADDDNDSLSWMNPDSDEIDALDAEIDRHPAHKTYRRLADLQRVLKAWNAYSLRLSQLLTELEESEEVAAVLMRNFGDTSAQDEIVLVLDQGLIAYVAGLGAVVDHARILSEGRSKALRERYEGRTKQLLSDIPSAPFLAKLRNYVLHNVAAPWEFGGTFGEGGVFEGTQISLSVEALLENKSGWSADAKAYLRASGTKIQLSPLLEVYRKVMVEHIDTLMREVYEENEPSMETVRELARKRNLLLTGGITDGDDWEDRMAHIQENIHRKNRGEPELNYETGLPFERGEGTRSTSDATE